MKLYRTRTQQEFDWLGRWANSLGYVFYESTAWEDYRERTVVYYLEGDKGYISHEPIEAVRRQYPEEDYPIIEISELMKEDDPLAKKIEERNNKSEEELVNRPTHYENDGKDLFDEWHERYCHSDKTYTGREVFIEIMKSVAERYVRRYPNKNQEDLGKGIYTLERLKEYEENTK